MADESQMIDIVDQKITNVADSVASLHAMVIQKFDQLESKINEINKK